MMTKIQHECYTLESSSIDSVHDEAESIIKEFENDNPGHTVLYTDIQLDKGRRLFYIYYR